MSQTIDSKVVEMKFDNSQFEGNVRNSINTLGDLKSALNMDGVSDSLSGITKAAQNVDVSSVGEGVDELQVHFSALDVMATTILANITNSAVNAGKTIVSAITGAFAQGGWQRSANIEQAEFRLEGLGMDVEEVMANANEAVKGTAFGLDEAAKAASVFGASGIEAGEDMTSTLRAVAGVAAMTGDSYDSIANIFESVAGNGKLMTYTMRQLETRGLNVAATLGDVLGYTETEIREMVSNGEIDFKTFSDAMDEAFGEHAQDANKTFSGALANMKTALSRFGADVCTPLRDNLRDVFNGITPVIDNIHEAAAPAINGLSDLFEALASKVLDFFNIFDGTGTSSFFEFIGNGIEKLANAINNFDVSNFVSKFKMTDDTINNLKSTFQGLISFLDLVRQAFGFVINVVGELLTFLAPVGSAILNVTGKFGDWITRIDQMAKENEVFATASEKVIGALEKVKGGLRNFKEAVAEKFDLSSFDGLGTAFDNLKEKMSPVTTALKNFKETVGSACKSAWASVKENFSPIIDKFKEFGSNIKDTFQEFKVNGNGNFMSFLGTLGSVFTNGLAAIIENVGTGISKFIEALGNFDFSGITGLLSSIGLSEIWINLGKISDSFKNMFSSLTSGGGDKGNSILLELKGILSQYQKELRAATLIMIAAAIAILAGALVEISNIEDGKLASSLAGIGTLIGELVGACFLINKINFTSSLKSMSSLVILSKAIKNLASACVELGQLDWGGIARGLTGIGGLFTELYAFLYGANSLIKVSGKGYSSYNMFGLATSIVILASAIKILQSAVTTFGSMSWNDLAKGLTGVGALLGEIYAFLYGANSLVKVSTKGASSYNMIGLATSIVILATGIKILQSAVTAMGELSWNDLAKGLVGVTTLITEIIIFLKAVSNLEKTEDSYNLIGVASSIVILATGIKILQSAVTKLAGLSWNELAKGLSGVGGLLLEIGIFLKAVTSLTKGKESYNLIGVASSIVILATGIKILQSAIIKFSGMSWEEIAKGLLTLAGALVEMTVVLKVLDSGEYESQYMKSASAMLVLALAADVLVPAIKKFSGLSWKEVATGLITLAGAFTILGVAAALLSGVSGPIMLAAAAFLVMGLAADALALALVLAGAGLVTISVGLTTFAGAMAASGTEIIAGIGAIILGIIALVPEIITGFIDGVMSVWDTITNFIIDIVHMLIEVIKETVPELVDGILEVIMEVCQSLAEYAPQIVDALMVLVEGVVDALVEKMPEIISKIKELVNEIFNGIFENMDTKGLLELVISIGLIAYVISQISDLKINLASAAKTVAELGILMGELAGVLAIIGQLTRIPGLEDGIDRAASMLEGVGNAIGSLIGGLVGGIMTGIADDLPQIAEDLSNFMVALQPFIDGASQIDSGIAQSISSLAGAILAITAAEVIEGIASWFTGGSSIVKFGEELAEFGPYFAQYAESISGINTDDIEASSAAAESIAAFASSIPNEGGVLAKFVGDNSLEKFGEELAAFGPNFASYAESVSGLDTDAVTASVAAAEAVTAFADTIPNEGGVLAGIVGDNTLSNFAQELAVFGPSFAVYAASIKGIDTDAVVASAAAAESLSAFANTIGNEGGILAAIVGDNSLGLFGIELASFGPHFAAYADSVSGIDTATVRASASAATTLAEFANTIGNSGGIVALFAGDNSLAKFGRELAKFGPHFAEYADSISGIDTSAVTASAAAAESLSAFANNLPTEGGIFSLFTGEEMSLSKFGKELADFGPYFAQYASEVSGIDPGAIDASDTIVKILDAMCGVTLPETGGVFGWLTGRTETFSELGADISGLGLFINNFIDEIKDIPDIDSTSVSNVINILDAMLEIDLPEKPGIFGWLKGRTESFTELGVDIAGLGLFINTFVDEISTVPDMDSTKVSNVIDILNAMLEIDLPERDGLLGWLTGRTESFTELGADIAGLGLFIGTFVNEISDIPDADSSHVSNVVDILDAMLGVELPETDGILGWIKGRTETFTELGADLSGFGFFISTYANEVSGLSGIEGAVEGTETAVDILNAITGVTLPEHDGIIGWITGRDYNYAELGEQLGELGSGLCDFSNAIKDLPSGIKTKVQTVADIMDALNSVDLSNGEAGFFGYIMGTTLDQFGNQMSKFAKGVADFSVEMENVDVDAIQDAKEVTSYVVAIGNRLSEIDDIQATGQFGDNLVAFGEDLEQFCGMTFDSDTISSSVDAINELAECLGSLGDTDFSAANDFVSSMTTIAQNGLSAFEQAFITGQEQVTGAAETAMQAFCDGMTGKQEDVVSTINTIIDAMLEAISDKNSDFDSAGQTLMTKLISGIEANSDGVSSACTSAVSSAVSAIRGYYNDFYSAGAYLCTGIANGIGENTYQVTAKASAMASAAKTAAAAALDENSPSKEGFKIGDFFGIGFINGIVNNIGKSFDIGQELAENSITGLSSVISRISDFIDGGMDVSPVITPVLDLSNVKAGMDSMNGMFAQSRTLAFAADNASFIADSMNRRNIQNDSMGDVLRAIKDLNRHMTNLSGDTYNVNGVTYDDGSNVADAVGTLVHAAKIGRRA